MSRKKKSFGIGILKWVILLSMAGGFGLLSWWSWAIKPYSTTDNSVKITIAPGTTAAQLAGELEQRQLIRSAWAFRYLARVRNDEFKLYVGDYQLAPMMSPEEMINRLTKGATMLDAQRVTIPEGYTTEQIIDLLVQKGISNKTDLTKVITEDTYPYSFLKNTPKGVHRLEGYLFPNTYEISRQSSPHAIIDIFLKQFEKELTSDVQTQLDSKKFSVSEWVTLASLVEKEAVKESDRPLIAAVFLNRLKINQPLQSCATIQFLLGTPKPVLYEKDLQIPSPYNTYLHPGLPPGPIANPGHASLEAVLNPAKTDFLYFVAKKDGYHAFAKTYAEHLKNVKLYQ
ncbi:endolytic transglycosylase MltG [Desulfosporosinus sp. BICA1-9]|uniref:endolytic transglycosylase MltG n=1 Tax=Desulfosporosinus sp. BICA1-9 TaxID=1531958 RepID=UPI00054BB4D3|nr:endolytic transglycosylase MltG [Desulfosporosinus sp. BICA1-9]KJS45959.1 MAG: aminodeoxychorismate lyase [Peptococcaceae bacterium BRH_c23]KJS77926.1 MAG: aminodeoxychorismate lyase [Desulfosporosinus sp. BICA1-9]KJS89431.1 MAG: aminodeoxychorismate lyase [Desulfosporosinus sp. BICA1-9]HBW37074.1 endolytic transglycosylase MltG [Desulfosporosinus sp.]